MPRTTRSWRSAITTTLLVSAWLGCGESTDSGPTTVDSGFGGASAGGSFTSNSGGASLGLGGASVSVGGATFGLGGMPTGSGGDLSLGGASVGEGGSLGLGGASVSVGGATFGLGGMPTGSGGDLSLGGASVGEGGATNQAVCEPPSDGHFQMERLERGLVAVRRTNGNYVGWRMFGYEYDAENPARVSYNLYRDGALVANVTDSTNYFDSGASASASYTVSAVLDGVVCAASAPVTPLAEQYRVIPLEPPPNGTTPAGDSYNYTDATTTSLFGAVNDGTVGDVDGDGEYELVVIWNPSNSKDNSQTGYTGLVYMDCYEFDGTRLWRLNLGPNIRAGAHYTQTLVYDFDGDGKAEVAVKTAPGTVDGTGQHLHTGPAANDDDGADYRNSSGYILEGPEYLTVFEGATGAELSTVDFEVGRGSVSSWGDSNGNRVDRFTASVGFVSDTGDPNSGSGRPSLVMGRGYYRGKTDTNYGRTTFTAWTWRDGRLTRLWTFEANYDRYPEYTGQGCHSVMLADVDGDQAQEIINGGATIDSDGTPMCTTGFGHGDALHVSDFVLGNGELEVFMPHEEKTSPNYDVHIARTCEIISIGEVTGSDTGRGVAGDVDPNNPGAEVWSSATGLMDAASGRQLGSRPSQVNFLVWWDADESRETLDGNTIRNLDGVSFTADGMMGNNTTKNTPTLVADLFGDWREEVVWRSPNSDELRIYTTTEVTSRRLYTLMHDPQYRVNVSSELAAYNQPPHPSFHIGAGMAAPPKPDLRFP